jgi:hypothetical protein
MKPTSWKTKNRGKVTGQETQNLSVVIPTLGGDSLIRTIEQLNQGTVVPSEILVCIPKEEASRVANLPFYNVKVIITSCRGQVAQRAVGFQLAQQPMVLQLDDDIYLSEAALEVLVTALCRFGRGHALAPLYFDTVTGRCMHELNVAGLTGWLNSLGAYVICGAPWGVKRMGVVTDIGVNYGVDINHCGTAPFTTQWLPGGCVLCFQEDIIQENFFPYTGKAYCEDLIHAHLRIQHGTQHWVIPTARCLTTTPELVTEISSIKAQNKARRYLIRLTGGAKWRLTLYSIFSGLKRRALYITNLVKV